MDPDAAHKQMVQLAARIIATLDKGSADADVSFDANDLAEAVQALDGWLRKGGFLPKAWGR